MIVVGIGKTTICKRLTDTLRKRGTRFDGFYTEELRDDSGARIGFDVVRITDPERRLPLARLKYVSAITTTITR